MKVAFVHDCLTTFGGAERVLLKLHELYPEAPIYTLMYDKKKMDKYFSGIEIRTSYLQTVYNIIHNYKILLPFMPRAIEEFDLSGFDLVISSSYICAKGVNLNADTTHICYCHTPMRYAWDLYFQYNNSKNIFKRYIISKLMHELRIWDRISADRVDYFIANSKNVANRIKKHYKADAKVIYPPIKNVFYNCKDNESGKDVLEDAEIDAENKITINETKIGDYYLAVSRLVEYKKMDIIIDAFNENKKKLIVVGSGPEEKKLRKKAKSNIKFIKGINDEELANYYKHCKAFVFMAEEDFGMVMAEAEASGRPVIAYGKGGAKEMVNSKTGILIDNQDKDSLNEAIEVMEEKYLEYDANRIKEFAKRFSEETFLNDMKKFISEVKFWNEKIF